MEGFRLHDKYKPGPARIGGIALKNISILPPEVKQRFKQRKRKRILALGSVLVLVVFVVFYGLLHLATQIPEMELRALQNHRAGVEEQIDGLQEYKEMKERAETAEDLLVEAMGTIPHWDILLRDFGIHIPQGVWLTEVNASYQGERGDLTLRGWAQSHTLAGRWLEELQEVPGLEEVHIGLSAEDDYMGRPYVQFEINAEIMPGDPEAWLEGGF